MAESHKDKIKHLKGNALVKERNKERDTRTRAATRHDKMRSEMAERAAQDTEAGIESEGKHIDAEVNDKINNWRKRISKSRARSRRRARSIFR